MFDRYVDCYRRLLGPVWPVRIPRKAEKHSSVAAVVSLILLVGSFLMVVTQNCLDGGSASDEELTVVVTATGTPPQFVAQPKDPTTALMGAKVTFTAIAKDVDGDSLNVTWEWGDGTPNGTTTTGPATSGVVITNSHWYNLTPQQGRGDYVEYLVLNVTLDDGNGNLVTDSTSVQITMPTNSPPNIIDLSADQTVVDPSEVVTIIANASDPEGESLTWTFQFNNSVEVYYLEVNHTGPTAPDEVVWCNITHVFGAPGTYSITLNVSDALPPYQVWPHNVSATLLIQVVENVAPNASSTINVNPPSPIVMSSVGFLEVVYSIQAFDLDGDVLTLTWNFGDGSPEAVNTSAGGTTVQQFIQSRNYTEAGIFNITVTVTDGRPGHEVVVSKEVLIGSDNRPPNVASLSYALSAGNKARANETVNFTIVIQDVDLDVVEVVVNFGDGSPLLYLNLTEYVDGNLTAHFEHKYVLEGNYSIIINYTDNKIGLFEHNKSYDTLITVEEPIVVEVRVWDWWDYFTLSLVGLVPVLIVLRVVFVARRRKIVEAQGMSLEEWKLVSKEMSSKSKEKKQ